MSPERRGWKAVAVRYGTELNDETRSRSCPIWGIIYIDANKYANTLLIVDRQLCNTDEIEPFTVNEIVNVENIFETTVCAALK